MELDVVTFPCPWIFYSCFHLNLSRWWVCCEYIINISPVYSLGQGSYTPCCGFLSLFLPPCAAAHVVVWKGFLFHSHHIFSKVLFPCRVAVQHIVPKLVLPIMCGSGNVSGCWACVSPDLPVTLNVSCLLWPQILWLQSKICRYQPFVICLMSILVAWWWHGWWSRRLLPQGFIILHELCVPLRWYVLIVPPVCSG